MNPYLKNLLYIWLFSCLVACQTAGNNNIKPTVKSNDVAQANLNLGIEYLKRGQYEDALEKLLKAKDADPQYSPTYNGLGLLFQTMGDRAQAEEYYRKALKLNPNDSSTMNNYGRLLCEQRRYTEAEETFLKAANNPLYKTPELAITNAGLCAVSEGNSISAERYFRQALELNKNIPQALLEMADISFQQEEHLAARGYFQRFEAISRHSPKSLWLGIQIERVLKDKNAVASYELLLNNQFPDSAEAELMRRSKIR